MTDLHPMIAALVAELKRSRKKTTREQVEGLIAVLGNPTPDMLQSQVDAWDLVQRCVAQHAITAHPALRVWTLQSYQLTYALRLLLRAALGQPFDPAVDGVVEGLPPAAANSNTTH